MAILLRKNFHTLISSVEEVIVQRLKRSDTNSFLYVVPTKRKLRDLQREFLKITPNGTSPAFFLFTLETLAAHLFTLHCAPMRFIAGPTQAVLMSEAIRSVQDTLHYFRLRGSTRTIPNGTFQKILDVINHLKDRGVYTSTLYAEIEAADESEQWKLRDILTIYEAYEKILGDTFIDAAGTFKQLNTEWDATRIPLLFKSHFEEVKAVFISGFDEFSDPEMTMLHNLSDVEGVGTVVSFDYHLQNDELFGHLKDNYEKFIQMGFEKITTRSTQPEIFTRQITQHLFRYDFDGRRLSASDRVTLLESADRQAEVDTIAKLIKKLTLQKPDRDLSKICVAMYQPQTYTHLFRESFQRYGIPANITDRYALDQSPLVVSILALLAVQQNNFRLSDIQRALSSPYLDFSNKGQPVNAGNLHEVAAKLKITVGYKTWLNRIEQRLKLLVDERSLMNDEFEGSRLYREEQSLQKAKKDITRLSNFLHRFEEKMTPMEFKHHLVDLLEELHTVERIVEIQSSVSTGDLLEKDSRAYQKFLKFLDEFLDILAFEQNDKISERLSYYLERLKTTISQVRYNVKQKYGYGVYVTSFEETRGLQFDVMVIAGLVDGEFPPPYQPENFLSPSRRARKERYHLTEHRYLCYQALTNFTEHLYLTYPRKDGERELVSSSFLDAILKVIDVEDRRGVVYEDLNNVLYAPDEMLAHLGKLEGASADEHINTLLPYLGEELRQTFDHMRHAIAVEKSRLVTKSMPEYDGMILAHLSPESRTKLERFRAYVFSVSQLESYGRCPFQYFADKVLRLNVVSEAEEGLSPLERGGLLHELLFEFYINRRERNLKPLFESTDEEFHEALGELLTLTSRKINELYIPDIFWDIDREMLLGTATRKGVLQEFLEVERQRALEVVPSFFEATFGPMVSAQTTMDPLFMYEQPIVAGTVRLRGKVDRIELGKNNFTIIDYKSGSTVAKRKEIELGISLQLPVYLYAVEHILAGKMGKTMNGVAGIYYILKSPVKEDLGIGSSEHRDRAFIVKKRSSQLLENYQELRRIIDQAVTFVNDYVDRISSGEFPVAPKTPEKICVHCDFQTICRIQSSVALQQESTT